MNAVGDEPPARSQPTHSIRPRTRPARVAAIAGLAAAITAIGLGTAALIGAPPPTPPAQHTLREITVTSAAAIPLADSDILALLHRTPDYGPLADPRRRASCLSGLDYPASTQVLGARPIEIDGHPGVLLILPGDKLDTVIALAVASTCSSVNTGLLADTTVHRR